jgi:glutathione peroxidase-family protein
LIVINMTMSCELTHQYATLTTSYTEQQFNCS